MNKVGLTVFLALVLTGCALTPDLARKMTSIELCEIVYFEGGNRASVALEEMNSRPVNCNGYKDIVMERRQLRLQAQQQALQNLQITGQALMLMNQSQQVQQPQINNVYVEQPRTNPPLNIVPQYPKMCPHWYGCK